MQFLRSLPQTAKLSRTQCSTTRFLLSSKRFKNYQFESQLDQNMASNFKYLRIVLTVQKLFGTHHLSSIVQLIDKQRVNNLGHVLMLSLT